MNNKIKIVFSFVLGMIISGSVVYATVYNAKDVSFVSKNNNTNVNNVADALDELYEEKANKIFSGVYNLSPSRSERTISTSGKIASKNFVISAIPSTYKKLDQQTTVTANTLFNGIIAYDGDGNKITGRGQTCIKGSINSSVCGTSTNYPIISGYKYLFMFLPNGNKTIEVNANYNYLKLCWESNCALYALDNNIYFSSDDKNMYCKSFNSEWNNLNFDYIACK